MKDQRLFEEEQQIYEVIVTERNIVGVALQEVEKTIERKNKERIELEERLSKLIAAAKMAEPKQKPQGKKAKA